MEREARAGAAGPPLLSPNLSVLAWPSLERHRSEAPGKRPQTVRTTTNFQLANARETPARRGLAESN